MDLEDEYGNLKQEKSLNIQEFKVIDAIETFSPKEVVAPPAEVIKVAEDSTDSKPVVDTKATNQGSTIEDSQSDRLNRINKFRNTADTGKVDQNALQSASSTTGGASTTGSTTAASTTASASSATAHVVTGATTFAGGLTVVAAAVVAAATVGGGIMKGEPNVSCTCSSGADYLVFEMDVSNLDPDTKYKIVVTNPQFKTEYPVTTEGTYKQIVTGLTPYRFYEVQLVGKADELIGDYVYYRTLCYTAKIKKPRAVFDVNPVLDYDHLIYNLSYNVFISDHYDKGDNPYLEIYVGNKLIEENTTLSEDSYFSGELTHLSNSEDIAFKAYTTYDGEVIEIGSYGYTTEYPEDFDPNNNYFASYNFDIDSVTYSLDLSKGYVIDVNTGFSNVRNTDDIYIINVYNKDELIDTLTSNEGSAQFVVSPEYRNINIEFVEIKKLADEEKVFNKKSIEYTFEKELFSEVSFNTFEAGYGIMASVNPEVLDINNEYTCEIIQNNVDGTSQTFSGVFEEGIFSGEYPDVMLEDFSINSIKDVEFLIKYNDLRLAKYTFEPANESIELGNYDIDDDGVIKLPYEIKDDDNYEFYEGTLSIMNGREEEIELSKKGIIDINTLYGNQFEAYASITYKSKENPNVLLHKSVNIKETFEIEVNLDLYVSHTTSFYDCMYINFETTLDDKSVNSEVLPEIYNGEEYQSIYETGNKIGKYYKISADYDGSNSVLKYKLTAPGVDNEVHEVSATYMFSDNDAITDYNAGLIADSYPYIEYIKTTNTDGTANYYFNTGLESSVGHVGRIEYSYVEDDETKYEYTELTSDKTIKLINIPDRDYKFEYAVYYKNNDGLYYDVDARANSMSRGSIKYNTVLVSKESVLDMANATVSLYEIERQKFAFIDFNLNYETTDITKPIIITYDGIDYEITIPSKDDEGVTSTDDGYGLAKSYDSDTNFGYNIFVTGSEDEYSLISVELFKKLSGDLVNTADVKFYGGPSDFISSYVTNNGNVNDIIGLDNLSGLASVKLGEYTGKYNISDFTYTKEDATDYSGNVVNISANGFTKTDSRDSLVAIAYVDNKVVSSAYLNGSTISLEVDPAYTKFDVKILEIKNERVQGMNVQLESYQLEYNYVDYESFEFDAIQVVDNVELSNDGDTIYARITPTDSFEDYYIKVEQYYKAAAASNTTNIFHTGEAGETEVSFNKQYETSKVIVYIYRSSYYGDDKLYAKYEIVLDADIGKYEYNEGDDSISLPYELNVPNDAVISNDAVVTYITDQTLGKSGNITISELESNTITLLFNVRYELNGTTVNYSFEKEVELTGEVVFDYNIYSLAPDSSYGNFSMNQDIKYDAATDTIYYYINNGYYDEDNNEAPSSAIYSKFQNKIYYLKGNIVEQIGCFKLDYNESYNINVTTSGGSVINPLTGEIYESSSQMGNPADGSDVYVIESSNTTGVYITFLHTTIGRDFDGNNVNGINKCEAAFSIIKDGETILSKNIEFTEPAASTVPTNDAFNLDRASANSSVTKNQDDTINITVDTGFDSTENAGYAYKLLLYEKTNYYYYEKELVYTSGYLTDNEVTLTNLPFKNYEVSVEVYSINNGEYAYQDTYDVGRVNSPIALSDWKNPQGLFTNILELDTNYMNPDYLDGSLELSMTLNNVSGTLDLSNTSTSQTIGGNTITVTDVGDGILRIEITANNYNDPRGEVTISEGNKTIGYKAITYTI